MPVTSVTKDHEALTLTVITHFGVAPDRIWQLWSDPRQLEQWWGPPTYPATVVVHDLTPGGHVRYFMTGPEGNTFHGYWQITSVEATKDLEFSDGFSDADGNPDRSLPMTTIRVSLDEQPDGTQMQIVTLFPTADAMQQMIEMGMEEGMAAALGQIDGLLASAD